MDIHMPVMDGLKATEQIMAYHPTPILIVSTLVKSQMSLAFKAISVGALDTIEKPVSEATSTGHPELIRKVKSFSKIKVVTHLAGRHREIALSPVQARPQPEDLKIVAIAASTGGPKALSRILRSLPAGYGAGVLLVQHISSGFTDGLADWLNSESQIAVRTAERGDRVEPGVALVAPDDFHMLVVDGGHIRLNRGLPIGGHRPAATVLLTSVAQIYGKNSVGVILTGMGADGAVGIAEIKQAGGKTIAQDGQSCVVFGMPKVAIEMGVVDRVLPVERIAQGIIDFTME
jgi:two-component system chemotaxis response regulator CheB